MDLTVYCTLGSIFYPPKKPEKKPMQEAALYSKCEDKFVYVDSSSVCVFVYMAFYLHFLLLYVDLDGG